MKFKYTNLIIVLITLLIGSCKEENTVFEDPYQGGIAPLGIKVNRQQIPVPAAGIAGTTVSIQATGLMQYKDKLSFLFNGEKADIVEVTDAGLKVKVPGRASTGVTAFVVDGQLVFGPNFSVLGLVNRDYTYKVVNGTNGLVTKGIEVTSGNFILLGNFTNYDNKGIVKPIRRIVRTLPDGTWDRSFQSGEGANGTLYGMAILNSKYYLGGSFSGYSQRGDGINNITRINTNGVIDTVGVTTYTGKIKYVSPFNGGVDGSIRSIYSFNGKIVATGDFKYYLKRRYDQPSYLYKDSTIIDSVDVRQLIRFNTDGSIDSTWRYDINAIGYKGHKGKSLPGGTGRLFSMMHTDGKILAYGQFKKFDDVPVGYIIRLNPDGSIDNTFNQGGAGADDYIDYVSYNETTNKYLLVGRFKSFNGKASRNMVLLNYDGSVDESFSPKVFEGGTPFFAKQLDDGLSVISGDFKTYDGTSRQGFLIVNNKGELAAGYNTIGNLLGSQYRVNDIVETKSADGRRALLIMGEFYLFDNLPTNNIVRVTIE